MEKDIFEEFKASVSELFQNMFDSTVEIAKNDADKNGYNAELVSFVGFSGPGQGIVCMEFPTATALGLVSKLVETDLDEVGATVTDGVAEVVNMVAGNAKARLTEEGAPAVMLGLPTVVVGENYKLQYPKGAKLSEMHFRSSYGNFRMRVSFKAVDKGAET